MLMNAGTGLFVCLFVFGLGFFFFKNSVNKGEIFINWNNPINYLYLQLGKYNKPSVVRLPGPSLSSGPFRQC